MPQLTAIVSAYNSGKWIEERIINLKASTADLEIVVVNADSPDVRDHEIPLKYGVKYLKLPHRISVYAAWNEVIKVTDSEFITNANTDDTVSPVCYQRLIDRLNSGFDFAYPSWYVTTTDNLTWDNIPGPLTDPVIARPGHYRGDLGAAGVGHFPMWRRSLHVKHGYFNGQFNALGDAEWWLRCHHGGAKFSWIDEPLGCYLWRNGDNLWNRSINAEEWAMYHGTANRLKG